MWTYNKVLQYPINIKCPNPRLAKYIISQYGGPDGELAASLRYLSQRFAMPDLKSKATLNDIGTEELAHLEMVGCWMFRQPFEITKRPFVVVRGKSYAASAGHRFPASMFNANQAHHAGILHCGSHNLR